MIGILLFLSIFVFQSSEPAYSGVHHAHNESSYQHAYCAKHKGIEEFILPDKTRVDCLTDKHAIEFDFSNKWAEAIGQALHYGLMTGKTPKVIQILDEKHKQRQRVYFERIRFLGQKYNFAVEFISDEILNLNKQNQCGNKNCKCRKKKYEFSTRPQ